jgi:N-acetylglucosamine-6-phosphate deacetylase
MNTLITNADIFTPVKHIASGAILIEGRIIQEIGTPEKIVNPAEAHVIDACGNRVIPGLIDTHIHGAGGFDISAGGTAGAAAYLATQGITGFLASTHFVMTHESLLQSVAEIAQTIQKSPNGARILGIHMEGPWVAANRSPFSKNELCYPISRTDIELFQKTANGQLRMVTFAPELEGALDVIPWLRGNNIIPSIGHTNANYETVMQAVKLGLNHSTHTYNAMLPMHHRSPGAVGAIMDSPEIYAEVIGDGYHVLPPMMRLLIKAKGPDKVSLVSDAVPLAGMPAGTKMTWAGLEIGTDGEISILSDGRPAGAYKLLNQSIKVLIEEQVATFSEAVSMASLVPAGILGVHKGRLEAGYDADIVIMDDRLNPLLTMVEGQVVFSKDII